MAEAARLNEVTSALADSGKELDRLGQILRPAAAPAARVLAPPRERIQGYEGELLAWLDSSKRWLRVVQDHLNEHAPRALEAVELDALSGGLRQLRRSFSTYVFDPDSTLAEISGETQEGAELQRSPLEQAYLALAAELDPYRELTVLLASEPSWKLTQTPTEIRTMLRQRTADSAEIRRLFNEYAPKAMALVVELERVIQSDV